MPPRPAPNPAPELPTVPEPPPPPPVQQHVHFVLRVRASLRKRGPWVPHPPPQEPPPPLPPPSPAVSNPRSAAARVSSTSRSSRPNSASVQEKAPPPPPSVLDVDPASLVMRLQFRPWVAYDAHQEAHFPSPALEQQKKAAGKNAPPEHDIVVPPVPLSFTPEVSEAIERERALAAAAEIRAAEEAAAAAGQSAGPPASPQSATRRGTPKAGSHRSSTPPTSALPPEPLVWDGKGEEPPRCWYMEHHFMINVDEEFVRAMAAEQASLRLPLELTQPPPEAPPAKASKGQPPVQEPPSASARCTLDLGCASLLVGETSVQETWPAKLRPLPAEFEGLVDGLSVSLQALTAPPKPPEEPSTKGGPKSKATTPKRDAQPEPELKDVPGDPLKILTPELASRLNPLVIQPSRAKNVPDMPATADQLDQKCEPIRLRLCWPAKHPPHEQLGRPSPWAQVQPVTRNNPAIHERSIAFNQAYIILAGDHTADEVLMWCQERPLTLEVHDRTAIPEPPEFPVAPPESPPAADAPPPDTKPDPPAKSGGKAAARREQEAAAAAAERAAAEAAAAEKAAAEAKDIDGYVCAIARVPLLELVRGGTLLKFSAPLAPHTTIRGAASLDWSKRPGNYAMAGAVLKGSVRTAVPIPSMKGALPLCERPYSRVVFIMDYRDSALFHLLEDTVRRQNAVALGLVGLPPPKPTAPSPPPPLPQIVLQDAAANQAGAGARSSQAALVEALVNAECSANDGGSPFQNGSAAGAGEGRASTAHSNKQISGDASLGGGAGNNNASVSSDKLSLPQIRRSGGRPISSKPRQPSDTGGGHYSIDGGTGNLGGVAFQGMKRGGNNGMGMGPQFGLGYGSEWGGGGARAGTAAPPKTSKTGKSKAQLSKDKDRKALRFRGFAGIDRDSDSEGSAEEEQPLTPATVNLKAMLSRLERIPLDMRLLQMLSSTKLPPSELPKPAPPPPPAPPAPKIKPVKTGKNVRPPSPPPPAPPPPPPLDLLTGFHLVDGVRRIIMLEGLCDGAMRIVRAIMDWCLEMLQPEPSWLKRKVLHNSKIRYPIRLWAELGADLHIVKLGAPLQKIISDASSYATGKVRVECIIGLRRLGAVSCIKSGSCWARLLEDLQLYPSPNMVHLVDKKFGGELSKADVFGVEVKEFESDEEDGGVMGLVEDDDRSSSSRRSHSRSRRGTRKSRAKSRTVNYGGYERIHPPLMPLETQNDAYIAMREKARERRATISFQEEYRKFLQEKAQAAAPRRQEWESWNPYRQATRELCDAVDQGVLTLEDTMRSWSMFHTLNSKGKAATFGMQEEDPLEEATREGWVLHPEPFRWPVPKTSAEYAQHPHAPSDFRRAQLEEPWEEEAVLAPLMPPLNKMPPPGVRDFSTTVHTRDRTGQQDGLFGQDPDFWRTVHLSPVEQQRLEAEIRTKEKLEWSKKVVVQDPVMRATFPCRPNKPAQEDKYGPLLHDEPLKKSLRKTFVPQGPISMYAEMPWSGEMSLQPPRSDPSTFLVPGQDFKNAVSMKKRSISKLGPGQQEDWRASLHDKIYSQY